MASKPMHQLMDSKATELENSNLSWGRNQRRSWKSSAICAGMVTIAPVLVTACWIALEHFDGSFSAMVRAANAEHLVDFIHRYHPSVTSAATYGYIDWVLFQALLYTTLPGKGTGQLTPAGNLLEYRVNGLYAWQLTIALTAVGAFTGYLDLCLIADHWEALLVVTNVYGFLLSALAYIKAYLAPSHAGDRKFSGSAVYDFYMGIELNPRFGPLWDWKLFHNGRPGIVAWTLIDISFTALQYRTYGYITNSIIIADMLHTIYVVDFFINEDWYIRTIDICHDHFGFYLAWGSAAWLPPMYTLQVQYLARHPLRLSWFTASMILGFGIGGYVLFRSVNHQKNLVRRTKGDCTIWGRKAGFIRAHFKTADGVQHESLLLTTGWWQFARHMNYVGDLILSYSMCAACGFEHILPWIYAIFMTIILVHRCYRDEKRCSAKYGKVWEEYCRQVPWRLVPGIF